MGPKEVAKALSIKASNVSRSVNHEKVRGMGVVNEEAIVNFIKENGRSSIKAVALALFDGDYAKAKNMMRNPVSRGTLVRVGRGEYEWSDQ